VFSPDPDSPPSTGAARDLRGICDVEALELFANDVDVIT